MLNQMGCAMQKFIVHYSDGGRNPGSGPTPGLLRPSWLTWLIGAVILVVLMVVAFFALTVVLVVALAFALLFASRLLVNKILRTIASPKQEMPLARSDGRVNVRVVRPDEPRGPEDKL